LTATAGLLAAGTANPSRSETDALGRSSDSIKWLAFYGVSADEAILATYDVVVLDPEFQGSIDAVAGGGARVCGYVSLGEIRTSDPLAELIDRSALLSENPDWPGTRRVDIRHSSWRSLVLERRIPALLTRGFTGLMADTLDTASYLEQAAPARYRGMRKAAIALVDAIRARWPGLALIMNRGYALLPDVVEKIDAVIAESLVTSVDKSGSLAWVDPGRLELQLSLLRPAKLRRPALPILSLDYWHPADTRTIAEIYRLERELGHHPYVATRSLDRIVPETH
jgi:uncharacterized protein (TIGR01370 family)